ncbi:hypothetical protein [Oceanidesulfovibrio marinus]|uniref:Uncharacterized protein n=1 Tax=Oceanidesulfovibrio marinus TaxID=370038 RepID=A0A6P1ZFB0_9BACT|nr:hypothetical protein [Oceanidesulfovibrio marinus]TVM33322.1 hypothetical protein DQK91_11670 [Oceanidesulfovibrio marinus]
MSILLDGLDLSGLRVASTWDGETAAPPTIAETSLDGSEVVWEGPAGLERITLAGGDAHGWITRTTLDRLAAMAAAPGGVYPLTIDGRALSVRFRNEDPPALSATPVEPASAAGPDAPFRNVRISLVVVG